MLKVLVAVLLMAGSALAATEHYYVDDDEQAHEFDDGTGTYDNPVPLEEINVTAPRDEDDDAMIPARLRLIDDFALWEFEQTYYVLDDGLWAEIPTPELYLTLSSDVLQGRFISKDTHHTANATGGVGRITWDYSAMTATSGTLDFLGSGNDKNLHFSPLMASSTRGNALHYRIEVRAEPQLYKSGTIEQDAVAMVRQQYLDRDIRVPGRSSRWLSGAEIKLQTDLITNYGKLKAHYKKWVKKANKSKVKLRIESSTRKPRQNVSIKGAARKSLHQYGCAYDIGPIKDLGGKAGIADDQEYLKDVWQDSLGLRRPDGYAYIKGNTVHVQIYRYEEGVNAIINLISN